MPLRLQFLGTGSPKPRPERAGTSLLVHVDERQALMIDCGPGTTWRLVQAGVHLGRVNHLFFTHLHFDHCTDYPYFGLARWDQAAGQYGTLKVFGPPGTETFHNRIFGDNGAFQPDIAARRFNVGSQQVWVERGGTLPRPAPEIEVRDIPTGPVAKGDGWKVTAGRSWHAQPWLECYCYRIDTADRSIVFSGDTGIYEGVIELARGADVLIHMCGFTDAEAKALNIPGAETMTGYPYVAATNAARAGVGELVLTHLQSDSVQSPEQQAKIIESIRPIYQGPVRWAHDLMFL